jgi:CHASE3 domain sensor protein
MNRILASLNIGRRIILVFSLLILLFLVVMITVEVAGIPGTTATVSRRALICHNSPIDS